MKKTIEIIIALMALLPIFIFGKGNVSNPVLRFNQDGKFKIVQFTDIHFQYNSYRSDSALMLMKTVIEKEKPDLVVLTGDVVCSKETRLAWRALSQVMIKAKTPWAVTLGNHDVEYELTGKQIMETIVGLPYNYTSDSPKKVAGHGNYLLRIKSSQNNKTSAILYFLDSHTGFHSKTELGSYEWIEFSQIEWYRKESSRLTRTNGGNPFPALAFFHIPLPEYKEIIGNNKTVGIQEETVCSPDINSGMYSAFLEAKDVMGMFVGHDHDNNYIGCLRNICLAYGNASGRQSYGKIGRGARVIELYEGERKFDTWIQKLYDCDRDKDLWTPTNDYQRKFFVSYPDSFNRDR